MDIRDYIPFGKENAIHLQELVTRLGISEKTVKTLVKRARKEDMKLNRPYRLLSGRDGYWYSIDVCEIRNCADTWERQGYGCLEDRMLVSKGIIPEVDGDE